MSTTFQINEVAQRSGFTPATLRYYEGIGLLPPADRSDAGYRLYDEASLERLRFIARAKQLGCSLDEIAELVAVRDGGRCAHVQDRLRATVEAKLTDARHRVAELVTLTAELEQAAAGLSVEPVDGPCDDTCACITTPSASGTSVPLLATTPASGTSVPIACTLPAGEMSSRVDEWHAVLAGVTARHALDGGLRLRFTDGADVAGIARLAAAEQDCCRFFDFALVIDAGGVALEVRAPADAQPVLTALFGAPG